jgi:hypothetical protein
LDPGTLPVLKVTKGKREKEREKEEIGRENQGSTEVPPLFTVFDVESIFQKACFIYNCSRVLKERHTSTPVKHLLQALHQRRYI